MSTEQPPSFRCALVGADSLLLECGELLSARGHEISVVAAGSPRVARWARSKGLPVIDASGPAAGWSDELAAHDVEWLFAITHLAVLPEDVLRVPTKGAVNFHDGPLPRYAGLNAPAWALLAGEETYGISWHLITEGIDEGDLLKTRDFDVADGETSLSLNTRNFEAAIDSFAELIDELAAGTAVAVPQDRTVPGRTISRHERPPAMSVLDWRRPASELDALVRALTFGPYPNPLALAKVDLGAEHLAVVDAAVLDGDALAAITDEAAAPGTVLSVGDDALVVAAGEGALAIRGVATLEGAEVALADLAARFDLAEGATLPVLDDERSVDLDALGDRLAREEAHHLRALTTLDPVEVPWARTRPAGHVPHRTTVDVEVPSAVAGEPGVVTAALALVLGRLTGKDRFHLGLVDGAWAVEAGAGAALLSPATAVAVEVADDATVAEVSDAVSASIAAARDRLPFGRDLIGRHPDLAARPELAARHLLPVAVRVDAPDEPDDGTVVVLAGQGGRWSLQVDDALVDTDDVAVLRACLETALVAVAEQPDTRAATVDLLGPDLRHRVLEEWNDTARPRAEECIHHLVEQRVDENPDLDAVIFEDTALTYRELDERANRLAHHLIGLGVEPDHLVGIHVGRGLDLVVAAVAVHKAGGAYVPLDPTYPADRLEHMITDSGARVILTTSEDRTRLPRGDGSATVVVIDADRDVIAEHPTTRPDVAVAPHHLAYCIYTSGSTGLPKGVLVEHRNVTAFFAGMDERVAHELPATWFAVTSLSFDISVLELLYTLGRGFTVVVYHDRDRETDDTAFVEQHADAPMDFSLFYFSGDAAAGEGSSMYRLLLDGARFADEHGFKAVWTPERHFHAFGGLYPQPAITGAAVAAITENVQIRAGSVVLPLHHPVRVAEAWSLVDNLSDGRVGVSVASGWQPNDFVLRPEAFADAKARMFSELEVVKQLWRGEAVTFDGPTGPVEVRTLPRPVQPELPVWVTTAGNPETYIAAGKAGANVLTHLLGQSIEQLEPKIALYRQARAEAGHDPEAGVVSLMLHTYVGHDEDVVRDAVREPLKSYLGESFSLLREYAWAFPAFQRPEGSTPDDSLGDDDFRNLSEEDLDAVLEFAFLRYYETSGLFGTPDRCRAIVDRLKGIGVDEVACLIDFGVEPDDVLDSLPLLDEIRRACNRGDGAGQPTLDQSPAAQITRHEVTHLQCTPSMARMFTLQDDTRDALAGVDHLFVGGEAFPVSLARELRQLSRTGNVTNMYGPTETTIWSTTWPLDDDLDVIPIGTPIANTRVYVLDRNRQPVPPGVAGELWIGGDGVVRGYHERPDLTAERFVPDPFRGGEARMYLTGDLARWRAEPDGSAVLEFLGRIDHQVKIRGYRIELGEIEARLGQQPEVRECVAVVREDTPGDQQLVAYASTRDGADLDPADVKDRLRTTLPEVMVPAHVVVLDDLPHTPNGKIARNDLPSLAEVLGRRARAAAPVAASNEDEQLVLSVWEETLGTTGIGVDDNFFDIGGHSLLIVRMHRTLKERLDRPISLTELYRHPTVRSFAASLADDDSTARMQSSRDRAARRRERMQRQRARR